MIAFLLGLVALPLLCSALPRAQPHVDTAATPDHNPGVLLPVMKRTNLLDKDGVVAPQVLKNQIARLTGLVVNSSPALFTSCTDFRRRLDDSKEASTRVQRI